MGDMRLKIVDHDRYLYRVGCVQNFLPAGSISFVLHPLETYSISISELVLITAMNAGADTI